uniref:Paraquat-inducible protein A n=1 Tax=Panagrolaimus superbus TaxID=310955 RepID=A0A914YET9_9BILA
MERRLLSRRCGDLSGQYYGANVKDDRHRVAVLGMPKGHGKRDSERMHLIYEVVEFVGRWSMIDVFVIAVLSALVRMGGLMSIYPAMGALMFALVVIMTMFSAMTFDPRLSWDRQPESEHEES